MKNFTPYLIFSLFIFPNFMFAQADQAEDLPFSIDMVDVTHENWEGLHSFAFAEWNGIWVFIGGRTNGLHGFFLATGFPVSSANDLIWAMDPITGDAWSYDTNLLPDNLTEVLRSTNGQFVQSGNFLYLTGGYGKSLVTDDFVTFPTLTAIDLAILVPAVISETSPTGAFQQIEDSRIQVCGGEMLALNGDFHLAGGNKFSGRYSDDDEPEFEQEYTNEIKKFNISNSGGTLAITNYTTFSGSTEYHRRDFSLAPVIFPNNSQGLGLYGGVFRPEAPAPFDHPIYISENNVSIDQSYAQKMSHYTCPVIPIYNGETQEMYSIFFGGLSLNYFDHDNGLYVLDDLVPFIDDITTLVKHADGTSEEIVLPIQFDEFLGSNAKFILSPDIPHHSNKVIQLENIAERTLLGYVFGGIKAQFRNFTPSSASNRLFAIYLTPSISPTTNSTTFENLDLVLSPNPASDKINIKLPQKNLNQNFKQIDIINIAGQVVKTKMVSASTGLSVDISELPKGMYQVKLKTTFRVVGTGRFLKM